LPFKARSALLKLVGKGERNVDLDLLFATAKDGGVPIVLRTSAVTSISQPVFAKESSRIVELLLDLIRNNGSRQANARDLWWVAVRTAVRMPLSTSDREAVLKEVQSAFDQALDAKAKVRLRFEEDSASGRVKKLADVSTLREREILDQELKLLAYAQARLDPRRQAANLLGSPYEAVRRGAIAGLWACGDDGVFPVLVDAWRGTKDPIAQAAAYRAIDLVLLNVEANAGPEAADRLEQTVQKWPDDAVLGRVKWTISSLRDATSLRDASKH
jgi:hypothetical protein